MKLCKATVGLCAIALGAMVAGASGQAVTSISGGGSFPIYYGGSTGDVIGYRFDVTSSIVVTDLGVWNADADGLTSDHMIGIWDSTQTLLTSNTAGPADTPVGDWTYAPTANVTLNPGETYTIGALYTSTDGDSYISGPSSITTAPEVNVIGGVFPSAGSLGFVYPTEDTANQGRYGPNFLFVIPSPGALCLFMVAGVTRRRRRR